MEVFGTKLPANLKYVVFVILLIGVVQLFRPEPSPRRPYVETPSDKAWMTCFRHLRFLDPNWSDGFFKVQGNNKTGFTYFGDFQKTGLKRIYRCDVAADGTLTDLRFSIGRP